MNIDYLRVTVEHRGQVCELTVAGELDACVAGKFADAAIEAVGAAQGPVLVDLADSYARMANQHENHGLLDDAERLRARSRATREHAKRLRGNSISGNTGPSATG